MRRIAIVTALVVAFGGAAHAADPSWPLPDIEKPTLQPVEYASGWYLRGDITRRSNRVGSVDATLPTAGVGENVNIGTTYALGFGGGYKFKFFRLDGTFDYTQNSRTFTALANAYLDLGSWSGLTPYVGAGVGTSHLSAYDFRDALVDPTRVNHSDVWNLTWAWMAGVNYQVGHNLSIDVGYRYLNLGKSITGEDVRGSNPVGDPIRFNGLSAHEIRIGFRLMLD